jgi:hypothetical protein
LEASQLAAVTGLGPLVAQTLRQLFVAVVSGLLTLFLIAIVNRVVTRGGLAFAVLVSVLAVVSGTVGGASFPVSLVSFGVPVALLAMVTLYRFGLLTFVVAGFCHGLLVSFPMTLDMNVWFADGSVYAVALVVLIGALGSGVLWRTGAAAPT